MILLITPLLLPSISHRGAKIQLSDQIRMGINLHTFEMTLQSCVLQNGVFFFDNREDVLSVTIAEHIDVCVCVCVCVCVFSSSVHTPVSAESPGQQPNQKMKSSSCAFLCDANLPLLMFNVLFFTCCNVAFVFWFPLLVDTNKTGNVLGIPKKKTHSVEASQTQLEAAHPLVKRTEIRFGLHEHGWKHLEVWLNTPSFVNTNAALDGWTSHIKCPALVATDMVENVLRSHSKCLVYCHKHSWRWPNLLSKEYWFWSCSGRQNPFSKHNWKYPMISFKTHSPVSINMAGKVPRLSLKISSADMFTAATTAALYCGCLFVCNSTTVPSTSECESQFINMSCQCDMAGFAQNVSVVLGLCHVKLGRPCLGDWAADRGDQK